MRAAFGGIERRQTFAAPQLEPIMSTRDLVLSALFTAIIVAFGLLPPISLGIIPVPITGQSLGVMMAGVGLGGRRGTVSVRIVAVLVAVGVFPPSSARRPASSSAGSLPPA